MQFSFMLLDKSRDYEYSLTNIDSEFFILKYSKYV